jgi:hypothetical protein
VMTVHPQPPGRASQRSFTGKRNIGFLVVVHSTTKTHAEWLVHRISASGFTLPERLE